MPLNKLIVLQPTKQQLIDYANALIKVNNYAWAITNQNLPVLTNPPANYGDFATEFSQAKMHALDWTTNIFVEVFEFPQTIVNQAASLFGMEDAMITAYLNALIADPNNQMAKTGLETALAALTAMIENQVASSIQIQKTLATFGCNIGNDAKILTKISQDALADAGADQIKITNIQAHITELKGQIDAANTLLSLSEAGLAVSIFVALIGAVCCVIPGAQGAGVGLIIVGAAGLSASIAGTVIEQQTIKDLQDSIKAENAQVTGLNQDIILLTAVSGSFNDLYNANLAAQAALTAINNMWDGMAAVVQQLRADLSNVSSDEANAKYTQALTDFQSAECAWKQVLEFANTMAQINYSWQDTAGNWHNYGTQAPSINGGSIATIDSALKSAAA